MQEKRKKYFMNYWISPPTAYIVTPRVAIEKRGTGELYREPRPRRSSFLTFRARAGPASERFGMTIGVVTFHADCLSRWVNIFARKFGMTICLVRVSVLYSRNVRANSRYCFWFKLDPTYVAQQ